MGTSSVALDTSQYVKINVGFKSMILQAHNDSVRIVVNDTKPALTNTAFHTLGGGDAPFPLDIVDTNVWALAVTDKSSLIVTETTTSFATEESVSQLVMDISNAIDETAYDLNATAFSEVTAITKDYTLDNLEINFTTTSSRDITVTSSAGTVLFKDTNNIETSFLVNFNNIGFSAGENITVAITQTTGACSADVILRVKSGTNTLLGDPEVKVVDSAGNVYEDAIASRCMPVVDIDHFFTHAGATFTNSDTDTVTTLTSKDFLIITPAVSESHLITFHFTSTEANAEVVLYEAPTTTDNGTQLTLYNKNRKSANIAETQLFKDPVVSAAGLQLEHDLITGGKQSGGSNFSETGEEWVLAASTKYLVRYNNKSNQDDVIDWKITFLEPAQV